MLNSAPECRRKYQRHTDEQTEQHHPDDRTDAEDDNVGNALPHRLHGGKHDQHERCGTCHSMQHADEQRPHGEMHPVTMAMMCGFLMAMEMQMPFPVVLVRMEMPTVLINGPCQRAAQSHEHDTDPEFQCLSQ